MVLHNNYNQHADKAINSPTDFLSKFGEYMIEQTLLSVSHLNFDSLTAITTLNGALISGVECYNLYNSPDSTKNNDSYLNQIAKSVLYPTMLLAFYETMDFSSNINAMHTCKNTISALTYIVLIDQLIGESQYNEIGQEE